MKAPLRVAAKVAEKLRNWLTSELEPHGIYNIDQYAHHVVTIFLNDDLDIEDEPLSTVGDFLKDIYSLRSGKSLDRKKKAAVEFLKSVLSCDKAIETEIGRIIDELIVRIEETKDTKPSPRKLLGPLTLNVAPTGYKHSTRRNRVEQERRYNEAFPSLSGDTERNNLAVSPASKKGPVTETWQKSPINKENSVKSTKQAKLSPEAQYRFVFSDTNEAQACLTASLVFSAAIPEGNLPSPYAMEVEMSSHSNTSCSQSENAFQTCWKSAFQSVVPTKLFSPNTNSLPLLNYASKFAPKFRPPVIVSSDDHSDSFRTLLKYVDLFDPDAMKVFLHPETEFAAHRPSPEVMFARNAHDLEVANIIAWSQINQAQMRRKQDRRLEAERRQNNENQEDNRQAHDERNSGIEDEAFHLVEEVGASLSVPNDQNAHGKHSVNGLKGFCPNEYHHGPDDQESESSDADSDDSPLLGAVGGHLDHDDEDNQIVKTDDVLSFALQQLARYEMKHGMSMNDDEVDGSGSVQHWASFEQIDSKMVDNVEPDSNEKSASQSTCSSRMKIASIDSGMYANGDEECQPSPNEDKTSSSSVSSPHDTEKTPSCETEYRCLPTSATVQWRKTPGSLHFGDDIQSSADSTISGGGGESFINLSSSFEASKIIDMDKKHDTKAVWNEWTDPLSDKSWDSMIREDLYNMPLPQTVPEYRNIFQPPELSSCVDTNVSQILQSAYVNSLFAEGPSESSYQFKDSSMAINCADLEHIWFSNPSNVTTPSVSSPQEVVRGRTCSNWLENCCHLGVACPFSHPSI